MTLEDGNEASVYNYGEQDPQTSALLNLLYKCSYTNISLIHIITCHFEDPKENKTKKQVMLTLLSDGRAIGKKITAYSYRFFLNLRPRFQVALLRM